MKLSVSSILLSFVLSAGAQTTAFYYTSSPQSWVGHGETRLVLPGEEFRFTAYRNFDKGVSFSIDGNTGGWPYWYLNFAASGDAQLTPGTYLGATRWPFQSSSLPGLDFSGNSYGDNTLTGYFTVLEVQYGAGDAIESFAADFVQYDEGRLDWWNQGSIRFNSMAPIPEPSVLTLVAAGGLMLWVVRRKSYANARKSRFLG